MNYQCFQHKLESLTCQVGDHRNYRGAPTYLPPQRVKPLWWPMKFPNYYGVKPLKEEEEGIEKRRKNHISRKKELMDGALDDLIEQIQVSIGITEWNRMPEYKQLDHAIDSVCYISRTMDIKLTLDEIHKIAEEILEI